MQSYTLCVKLHTEYKSCYKVHVHMGRFSRKNFPSGATGCAHVLRMKVDEWLVEKVGR